MKKEQINWLREEPVELQDITIKALFPEEVETITISKNDYDRLYGNMTLENIELKEEIERLNNIINELDKFLKDKIDSYYEAADDFIVSDTIYHERLVIRLLYAYLQELKGDGSNE